ncbi:MAG: hypothetical protein AB7O73_11710, partial [Bacteroidia bacterium]
MIIKNNFISVLFFLLLNTALNAQAPLKINYQGQVRDNDGNGLTTVSSIGVRFVLSDASGIVHSETQNNVSVGNNGLFNTQIGNSVPISNAITWQNGPYTLSVSIDLGTGFQLSSVQPLASVPFALYAKKAPTPTLVLNGNKLSILGDTSSVILPTGTTYSPGFGLALASGTVLVNTMPNQTVN